MVGPFPPLEVNAINLYILAASGRMIVMKQLNEGTHPLGIAIVHKHGSQGDPKTGCDIRLSHEVIQFDVDRGWQALVKDRNLDSYGLAIDRLLKLDRASVKSDTSLRRHCNLVPNVFEFVLGVLNLAFRFNEELVSVGGTSDSDPYGVDDCGEILFELGCFRVRPLREDRSAQQPHEFTQCEHLSLKCRLHVLFGLCKLSGSPCIILESCARKEFTQRRICRTKGIHRLASMSLDIRGTRKKRRSADQPPLDTF